MAAGRLSSVVQLCARKEKEVIQMSSWPSLLQGGCLGSYPFGPLQF